MTPFSDRQQIRQHLHGDGSRRDGHGLPAPAERRSPARGSPDPPCCGRWFPYRYIPVDSYLSRIVRGGRTEFQCNGRLGRRNVPHLPQNASAVRHHKAQRILYTTERKIHGTVITKHDTTPVAQTGPMGRHFQMHRIQPEPLLQKSGVGIGDKAQHTVHQLRLIVHRKKHLATPQQFADIQRTLGRETYRGTVSKAKQIGEKFHIIPVTCMDMNVIIH